MSWSTIYINGKAGFKEVLEVELNNTWLQGSSESDELVMYWLREDATLRDFKLEIGSKIIFKYRLRFYASVDEYLQQQKKPENIFSKQEHQLVRKMVRWQKGNSKKKNPLFPRPRKSQKV